MRTKGKVPGKISAALVLWLHAAHYVQCRDSWTHLEDPPETLPGKSPKTNAIPLPATLLWKAAQGCGGNAAARNNSLFVASSPERCNILHTCRSWWQRTSRDESFLPSFSLNLLLASYFHALLCSFWAIRRGNSGTVYTGEMDLEGVAGFSHQFPHGPSALGRKSLLRLKRRGAA